MTEQQELVSEIKKLNRQIKLLNNPWRSSLGSFRSGMFQALGSLFGTLVVAALIIYVLSRLTLTQQIIQFFQQNSPSLKTF